MIELHVIFQGKVQGVAFRRTVCRHARNHAVFGTVKNLEDGSVEMVAQGKESEINRFLENIIAHHFPAHIDSIKKNKRTPTNKYLDFQIIH